MTILEFRPDYGPGPLWTGDGKPVDLDSLEVDRGLVARLAAWNTAYKEDMVPIEGAGDTAWLGDGRRLLLDIRAALGSACRVVVTEPW